MQTMRRDPWTYAMLAVIASWTVALLVAAVLRGARIAACEPPTRTPIVDQANGFSLCLPGNWRELRAGDPGWAVIYDQPNSQAEQDVANGLMQHFAVPLDPRDADTAVNLGIYIHPNQTTLPVAEIGEHYAQQLRDHGDTDVVVATVTLPVGQVAEVTSTTVNDISDAPSLDWFDGFVIVTPHNLYYVGFKCDIGSRGTYERAFGSIASTFKLLP